MDCTTFMVCQTLKEENCWIRVARVFHFKPPFALNKMAYWATFEPSQGSWAYWFIKVDANLHQFTLPEGGCTEIKLMKKAPSSGILRQIC